MRTITCGLAEVSQNSWVRVGESRASCVRAEDSRTLCVRAEDSRKLCVRAEGLNSSQLCGSPTRDDAFVQPVVEDPIHDDRTPVETGAEPVPIPCATSESETTKRELTHIHTEPRCTSCIKGKAQSESHKRIERAHRSVRRTESFEQVKSFGCGTSTVVETKGATDTFAVTWRVKMLNCLGLSDIILQCEPEPPPVKWAESVKFEHQERTVIRSSPRRSHQSNGALENYQTGAGTSAHNVGSAS